MNLDIEVYKQRYETFRHLDRVRWQMLQISVAVGTISSAVISGTTGVYKNLIILITGVMLVVLGLVMLRIQHAIRLNGRVLMEVGNKIGDAHIPMPAKFWMSRSNWVAAFIIISGLTCIIFTIKSTVS